MEIGTLLKRSARARQGLYSNCVRILKCIYGYNLSLELQPLTTFNDDFEPCLRTLERYLLCRTLKGYGCGIPTRRRMFAALNPNNLFKC